jgi:hypothetical protein
MIREVASATTQSNDFDNTFNYCDIPATLAEMQLQCSADEKSV